MLIESPVHNLICNTIRFVSQTSFYSKLSRSLYETDIAI